MTIVPRTGPLSASSAFSRTSWYQRGKSSDWEARTLGRRALVTLATVSMHRRWRLPAGAGPAHPHSRRSLDTGQVAQSAADAEGSRAEDRFWGHPPLTVRSARGRGGE